MTLCETEHTTQTNKQVKNMDTTRTAIPCFFFKAPSNPLYMNLVSCISKHHGIKFTSFFKETKYLAFLLWQLATQLAIMLMF